jgi:hypothetical protein
MHLFQIYGYFYLTVKSSYFDFILNNFIENLSMKDHLKKEQ